MSKLVLLLALLALVWFLAASFRRKARAQQLLQARRRAQSRAPVAMVPCRVCGALVDVRLAYRDGKDYLCEADRGQQRRRAP